MDGGLSPNSVDVERELQDVDHFLESRGVFEAEMIAAGGSSTVAGDIVQCSFVAIAAEPVTCDFGGPHAAAASAADVKLAAEQHRDVDLRKYEAQILAGEAAFLAGEGVADEEIRERALPSHSTVLDKPESPEVFVRNDTSVLDKQDGELENAMDREGAGEGLGTVFGEQTMDGSWHNMRKMELVVGDASDVPSESSQGREVTQEIEGCDNRSDKQHQRGEGTEECVVVAAMTAVLSGRDAPAAAGVPNDASSAALPAAVGSSLHDAVDGFMFADVQHAPSASVRSDAPGDDSPVDGPLAATAAADAADAAPIAAAAASAADAAAVASAAAASAAAIAAPAPAAAVAADPGAGETFSTALGEEGRSSPEHKDAQQAAGFTALIAVASAGHAEIAEHEVQEVNEEHQSREDGKEHEEHKKPEVEERKEQQRNFKEHEGHGEQEEQEQQEEHKEQEKKHAYCCASMPTTEVCSMPTAVQEASVSDISSGMFRTPEPRKAQEKKAAAQPPVSTHAMSEGTAQIHDIEETEGENDEMELVSEEADEREPQVAPASLVRAKLVGGGGSGGDGISGERVGVKQELLSEGRQRAKRRRSQLEALDLSMFREFDDIALKRAGDERYRTGEKAEGEGMGGEKEGGGRGERKAEEGSSAAERAEQGTGSAGKLRGRPRRSELELLSSSMIREFDGTAVKLERGESARDGKEKKKEGLRNDNQRGGDMGGADARGGSIGEGNRRQGKGHEQVAGAISAAKAKEGMGSEGKQRGKRRRSELELLSFSLLREFDGIVVKLEDDENEGQAADNQPSAFKMSRKGRPIFPVLAQWAGQSILRDELGNPVGLSQSSPVFISGPRFSTSSDHPRAALPSLPPSASAAHSATASESPLTNQRTGPDRARPGLAGSGDAGSQVAPLGGSEGAKQAGSGMRGDTSAVGEKEKTSGMEEGGVEHNGAPKGKIGELLKLSRGEGKSARQAQEKVQVPAAGGATTAGKNRAGRVEALRGKKMDAGVAGKGKTTGIKLSKLNGTNKGGALVVHKSAAGSSMGIGGSKAAVQRREAGGSKDGMGSPPVATRTRKSIGEQLKEGGQGNDGKGSKNAKEGKEVKEVMEGKEVRKEKEARGKKKIVEGNEELKTKEGNEGKKTKEGREGKKAKVGREMKAAKEFKVAQSDKSRKRQEGGVDSKKAVSRKALHVGEVVKVAAAVVGQKRRRTGEAARVGMQGDEGGERGEGAQQDSAKAQVGRQGTKEKADGMQDIEANRVESAEVLVGSGLNKKKKVSDVKGKGKGGDEAKGSDTRGEGRSDEAISAKQREREKSGGLKRQQREGARGGGGKKEGKKGEKDIAKRTRADAEIISHGADLNGGQAGEVRLLRRQKLPLDDGDDEGNEKNGVDEDGNDTNEKRSAKEKDEGEGMRKIKQKKSGKKGEEGKEREAEKVAAKGKEKGTIVEIEGKPERKGGARKRAGEVSAVQDAEVGTSGRRVGRSEGKVEVSERGVGPSEVGVRETRAMAGKSKPSVGKERTEGQKGQVVGSPEKVGEKAKSAVEQKGADVKEGKKESRSKKAMLESAGGRAVRKTGIDKHATKKAAVGKIERALGNGGGPGRGDVDDMGEVAAINGADHGEHGSKLKQTQNGRGRVQGEKAAGEKAAGGKAGGTELGGAKVGVEKVRGAKVGGVKVGGVNVGGVKVGGERSGGPNTAGRRAGGAGLLESEEVAGRQDENGVGLEDGSRGGRRGEEQGEGADSAEEGQNVSEDNIVGPDGWTKAQETALRSAIATVDPLSDNFWSFVALEVPGKSANECFSKAFDAVPTPQPKAKEKRSQERLTHAFGGDWREAKRARERRAAAEERLAMRKNTSNAEGDVFDVPPFHTPQSAARQASCFDAAETAAAAAAAAVAGPASSAAPAARFAAAGADAAPAGLHSRRGHGSGSVFAAHEIGSRELRDRGMDEGHGVNSTQPMWERDVSLERRWGLKEATQEEAAIANSYVELFHRRQSSINARWMAQKARKNEERGGAIASRASNARLERRSTQPVVQERRAEMAGTGWGGNNHSEGFQRFLMDLNKLERDRGLHMQGYMEGDSEDEDDEDDEMDLLQHLWGWNHVVE